MALDCDFSEIVEALDPNDPINNRPLSIDIGVECRSNDPNTNGRPTRRQSTSSASSVNTAHSKPHRNLNSKSKSNVISTKKPHKRDLTAATELLNRLRPRKQEGLYKAQRIMQSKTKGNNIFTTHISLEPTLRCPWCGDHKGYRYFTKHLALKCSARDQNMNQSTLLNVRKRRTRSMVDYKQFMDNNDEEEDHEDEASEDEYLAFQRYDNKKSNRTMRTRQQHHRQLSDDDDDYAPRRKKRKR
eukprot:36776_1